MDETETMSRLEDGLVYAETNDIVVDALSIIDAARATAYRASNIVLVRRNWLLGKRIATEELKGRERRDNYGQEIIESLAKRLTQERGRGFGKSSLYQYLRFYDWYPEIFQNESGKSLPRLSWSHYASLLRVHDPKARRWYEREAIDQAWNAMTLDRNISTQYYERLLSTQAAQHDSIKDEMRKDTAAFQNDKLEYIKNPMIAEFLGIAQNPGLHESELEGAIIANLQQFLLELGKGYAFIARQQHIKTDAGDFFIDLVFYNVKLKCYVLIDLKTGRITHQDVGQMDMYVRMYDELKRDENDNPTLGIVLCSETSEDIARYSVMHDSEQLFMSKYKLFLPSEEALRTEIETQKQIYLMQHGTSIEDYFGESRECL